MKSKKKWNKDKGYEYDSYWEESLVKGILSDFEYHPEVLHYEKPATQHKYYPDWKLDTGMKHPKDTTRKCIYIEAKGRFRDVNEYKKYKYIRESLCEDEELVFLFMNPTLPMPNSKSRKDGTKVTHAEWAKKNGFRCFSEKTITGLLKEFKR